MTARIKCTSCMAESYYDENTKIYCGNCFANGEKARQQYQELIYAVGNKYQNETRHETALRYIRKAEEISDVGACSTATNGNQTE